MGWRFTTSFGAEKKQETFSDFLLGGAAGGRLVFSFESSGHVGPKMESYLFANLLVIPVSVL